MESPRIQGVKLASSVFFHGGSNTLAAFKQRVRYQQIESNFRISTRISPPEISCSSDKTSSKLYRRVAKRRNGARVLKGQASCSVETEAALRTVNEETNSKSHFATRLHLERPQISADTGGVWSMVQFFTLKNVHWQLPIIQQEAIIVDALYRNISFVNDFSLYVESEWEGSGSFLESNLGVQLLTWQLCIAAMRLLDLSSEQAPCSISACFGWLDPDETVSFSINATIIAHYLSFDRPSHGHDIGDAHCRFGDELIEVERCPKEKRDEIDPTFRGEVDPFHRPLILQVPRVVCRRLPEVLLCSELISR